MREEAGGTVDKFGLRTLVSVILIAVVAVIVYVFPEWLFALVIAGFVAVAQFEFFRMVENRKIFVYKYFGTFVGSLVPVVIYIGSGLPDLKHLEPLLIVIASLLALVLQFVRTDNERDHLVSMAVTLFSLFYIAWFFSFFVRLRALPDGSNLVAFLIIVTKSTDIGAYLIGRKFGKTELIPRISPKKTKEGTVGGVLLSVMLAVLVGRGLTGFSVGHLIVLGVILASLGQTGDLAESLIKRDCGMKDAGKVLAGIGGFLDLMDSLLFTAPVFYFYVKTF
ncbi:MAG: hypothetical protein GF408_07385 [Candidatus Omnitrophica bacterium]|nr:hypothetical protein [Candidatus Omnitrophota bacterium]